MTPLDLAAKHIGKQEVDGPNDGPILREIRRMFGIPGPCSWCALFVAWILCRSHNLKDKATLRMALDLPSPFYVDSCAAWDQLPTTESPRPGDLVIFLDANGHPHHVGFVELPPVSLHDGAEFRTIEGNTSPGTVGSQNNGDGVYRRTRTWHPGGYRFKCLSDTMV